MHLYNRDSEAHRTLSPCGENSQPASHLPHLAYAVGKVNTRPEPANYIALVDDTIFDVMGTMLGQEQYPTRAQRNEFSTQLFRACQVSGTLVVGIGKWNLHKELFCQSHKYFGLALYPYYTIDDTLSSFISILDRTFAQHLYLGVTSFKLHISIAICFKVYKVCDQGGFEVYNSARGHLEQRNELLIFASP